MITLKSVKIFNTLSEETIAFSAKLCWKGKVVGDCSNRGCGGDNDVYVKDQSVLKEMEAYVQTLPSSFIGQTEIKSDLDIVITDLVVAVEQEKEKKKMDNWVKKQKEKMKAHGLEMIRIDASKGSSKTTACVPFNPTKQVAENLVNDWKNKNVDKVVESWQIV
jgi:hypothetical protein